LISFLDALPIKAPIIEPDVMTPHYGEYYGKKKPPVDYDKPNIIPFLTVTKTPFLFQWGGYQEKEIKTGPLKGQTINVIVSEKLQEALDLNGIGAKTALGYGSMHPLG